MKIYLKNKGLNPTIDNSPIINRQIELAKDGDTLIFPNGRFPLNLDIVQSGKYLYWEGDNDSNLVAGLDCQTIFKGYAPKKTELIRVNFLNGYGFGTKSGIIVNHTLKISDCVIKDWAGFGIEVTGDTNTGQGSSSFSRFDDVEISGCKGGMYFQGGDANQCSIYSVSVRDCREYGFYDHSFLGNQFFSCMVHYCNQNYIADDSNNRAGFYGCYSEQGSKPEYLDGCACWFGGLPANGIIAKSWAKVYSYSSVNIIN